MVQPPPLGPGPPDRPEAEPTKTRLGRILAERPEERPRIARAVGGLLAVTLVTIAAIGILLIWHLRRRAGLIREQLASGCNVSLAELELPELDADADSDGSDSPSLGSR
ncbi:hypothetical protein [Paludisphaera borealis]|uniref:Uncharacterized protein n=1 Tax=Paludisphaera borealis TaxID=1387353 RepID=A0A1U7CXU0_9BACT|nr:hypothetical protein [Paludisphaera borealis]APW63770.1 hypothetical protein BSF38_05346 [Paludisphaera borealis]MDR3620692.1 hypothetical protein [Paludisphaera borealis]